MVHARLSLAGGHVILACPVQPPRPGVSFFHSPNVKSTPLTTIVHLIAFDVSIPVTALIDSGSDRNFTSGGLCCHLNLKKRSNETIYQVQSVTGKLLRKPC